MKWTATLSRHPATETAVAEASVDLLRGLEGRAAHLLLCFVSGLHAARADELALMLGAAFPDALLLGCTAGSVIGAGVEVEGEAAVALAAAHLPGVELHPFVLASRELRELANETERWRAHVGAESSRVSGLVLLGDPFSGASEAVMQGLAHAYPAGVQIGGLASGGAGPGSHRLLLGETIHDAGFVGVALAGNVAVDSVVCQGCRPLGPPMFATAHRGSDILTLDGRKSIDVLNQLFEGASPAERNQMQHSLFMGIQIPTGHVEVRAGDFLVRNIVGADPENGSLRIGAPIADNQVVQFQLRDGTAASREIEARLDAYAQSHGTPSGALLFSCLGRGRAMYGVANHDCDALRRALGDVPVAGFFGNGEIGPIEAHPFLHGYTSAFGFFRPADP